MLQYTLFLSLAPFAAAVVLIIAGYAWTRQKTPVARALSGYLVFVAAYLAANVAEMVAGDAAQAVFFTQVEYLFMPFIPVLWLRFAFHYTGRIQWVFTRRMWVFGVLPLATMLLAWSNDLHHLLWLNHTVIQAGSFTRFHVITYGPWFWAIGAYTYLLLIGGTLLILLDAARAPRLFRLQSFSVAAGALLPLILNLVYVFKVFPAWQKDYTPLAFAIAGLFFAYGIMRHRLLVITPLARAILIEYVADPVLVLDPQQRVVDINPAAQRVMNIASEKTIGRPLEQVWPGNAEVMPLSPDSTRPYGWVGAAALARRIPPLVKITPADSPSISDAGCLYYELQVTPLPGGKKTGDNGWLVVLHDITQRKQAEDSLAAANNALGELYREVAEKSQAMAEANRALLRLSDEVEERVNTRTETIRQRAGQLEALTHVSTALRRAERFEEMLTILVKETCTALGYTAGAILLPEEDRLHVAAAHNLPAETLGVRHPRCHDPFWQAMQSGRVVRYNPISAPLPGCELLTLMASPADHLLRIAPMQSTGRTVGLLALFHCPEDQPAEDWPMLAIAEIGGNAIQRMNAMETLEQLVWDRTRHLSTLYEVTSITNEYGQLDLLLERVLERALEPISARVALIHLIDDRPDERYSLEQRPAETRLRLAASLGFEPTPTPPGGAPAPALTASQLKQGPWLEVLARGGILVLPDCADLPADVSQEAALSPALLNLLSERSARAYVGVPVTTKGRLLGVISSFGESLAAFSSEDIALLAAIADHAGVAVENTLLRQKAEEAAVMDERQRLARDLHDSVTQLLYSQVLFSQAGRDALSTAIDPDGAAPPTPEDVERARSHLERLLETSQQALKELRLLIYELRPLALQKEGLCGALRNRLETVEQRAGVKAILIADNGVELPPAVEAGLYGIAQEALNNVLKHARASMVTVRYEILPEQIELEISDNGSGFVLDPAEEGGGFGLTSMHERAAALGGTLSMRSEVGRGTSILVTLNRESAP
jgi:signal transduction histidine kinase/PAS domain-containing protein